MGGLRPVLPVVQGGMGVGISLAGLASAVANEGGIGVLSAALIASTAKYAGRGLDDAEALREEIRAARRLTGGVIGVNVMVALRNYRQLVRAACEEGADILFCGAGLPLDLPDIVGVGSAVKLAPIVSSVKAARIILSRWRDRSRRLPDAFIVEGPLAGGHLGFRAGTLDEEGNSLRRLISSVSEEIACLTGGAPIPIVAAGGIYSGEDIRSALSHGAAGVQMATRFVATRECDAPEAFKQVYLRCQKEDLRVIASPVGIPGRALLNAFVRAAEAGKRAPAHCSRHCLVTCDPRTAPYCISEALLRSAAGDCEGGLVFAGANAWRVDAVVSVAELFKRLEKEYANPDALRFGGPHGEARRLAI